VSFAFKYTYQPFRLFQNRSPYLSCDTFYPYLTCPEKCASLNVREGTSNGKEAGHQQASIQVGADIPLLWEVEIGEVITAVRAIDSLLFFYTDRSVVC